MTQESSEARCYRCNKKVNEGGYGDFNLEGKPVSFCSPQCRSDFWQKDHGIRKKPQKQVTIASFMSQEII